jgi:hypothetical protein
MYSLYESLGVVFILFIAHSEPLIVDVSMPFPSVHDRVAGAPVEPVLLLGATCTQWKY